MYIPADFLPESNRAALELVRDYPFATLMAVGTAGPVVTHLPLQLSADGSHLYGHVARANPQAALPDGPVLAIFHGPHAYVSPRWYATSGLVPTWNYAVVHVHGQLVHMDDAADKKLLLERLIAEYEPDTGWTIDSARSVPDLLQAIVGIEIGVTRIEAKFKLSQNRQPDDVAGVMAALADSSNQTDRATATLMLSHRKLNISP